MRLLKTTFLLILLNCAFFQSVQAQNFDQPVDVLGVRIDLKFCGEFNKISGVISSFTNLTLPLIPGAGFSVGTVAGSNPIIEICNYLVSFKGLTTSEQIFRSAEILNTLTGNNHNEELNFTKDLYDLTDVFVDEDGKKRPVKEILTRRNSRRINAFYRDYSGLANEYLGTNLDSRTRERQQADLGRLARVTARRSLIKDTLKCPNPQRPPKDYAKIYEDNIVPAEDRIDTLRSYIQFYRRSLLEMSAMFIANEEEMAVFTKDLNDLESSSYRWNVKTLQRSETAIVARPNTERNPNIANQERAIEEEETVAVKYQSFCGSNLRVDNFNSACPLIYNAEPLERFIRNYNSRWKNWVRLEGTRTTRGILNSPLEKVEKRFTDYNILCNRGEIREQIPRSSDNFQELYQERVRQCEATVTKKIKESGSLFSFYTNELVRSIQEFKQLDGKVKSFESYYLGFTYSFTEKQERDSAGVYTQNNVTCSKQTSVAEIQNNMAETTALNAEINEMILEQAIKRNAREEAKENRARKEQKESANRRKLQEERKKRRARTRNSTLGLPPGNGGI